MENDSNQKKKKVGLLKPQSIKKKLLVTTPNLKKKPTPTTWDSGCCQSKYELEKATNKYQNNTGINYKKW